MNLDLKSKDIINKQKQKYQDSKWSTFFNKILESESYSYILKNLIHQVSIGNRFRPALKDMFEFTNEIKNPKKIKVIFILEDSHQEVFNLEDVEPKPLKLYANPISFNDKIEWDDYGSLVEPYHSSIPVWVDFTGECIKALDHENVVFILEERNYKSYSKLIIKGKKCIIPSTNSGIYKKEFHGVWHKIYKFFS